MPGRKSFQVVNKNINKCEIRLENYAIPALQAGKINRSQDEEASKEILKGDADGKNSRKLWGSPQLVVETPEETFKRVKAETIGRYAVFAETQEPEQPKLCVWLYMPEQDVQNLLKLRRKKQIRQTIDCKMNLEYPKGISRILATELMYSVVRFCQKCQFNVAQTGSLLSIFYLTHHYFLGSFHTSAERTYHFFKEYMLLHCFECPPDSMNLFSYKESTHVVKYFCSLYLRHLPIIRLLTLPNFGFHLNYEKPPDLFEEMKPKGKKKDKGGKKGKDKKSKK